MDLQKFLKFGPDLFDSSNNILQAHNDIERPWLPLEDYLKGNVDMHIHYVFRVSDDKPRQFCAVLKLPEAKSQVAVENNLSIFDRVSADACAVGNRDGGKQEFVFVDDVEVMQEAECIPLPAKSVIKRLQFLDFCKCSFSNPTLQLCFSSIESTKILQDREIHGGSVPLNARRVLLGGQPPEKVVKRSSSIVNAVADNQRPCGNVGGGCNSQEEAELARLRIKLLGDGVSLSFTGKGGDDRLESVEVAFCPPDLRQEAVRKFNYCLPHWFEGD